MNYSENLYNFILYKIIFLRIYYKRIFTIFPFFLILKITVISNRIVNNEQERFSMYWNLHLMPGIEDSFEFPIDILMVYVAPNRRHCAILESKMKQTRIANRFEFSNRKNETGITKIVEAFM